jgi:hypothetical protein
MYWLGNKSQLSVENKLLLYEAILKFIWAYGVQLWGLQLKYRNIIKIPKQYFRIIINAPWYVTNNTLHHD